MNQRPNAGDSANSFDLNELCRHGEVTVRTVRYYVQQGLLPSPGLGAGARYGRGHLARLRLIRRMQRDHLPLAEIRRRLEGLDDDAVETLLESAPGAAGATVVSAVDYARSVLRGGLPTRAAPEDPAGEAHAGHLSRPGANPATSPGAERARWDRIALGPDIELHVRRPLSREDNRRVEKLLERARAILADGGD